jgi:hypothetical protein
MPPTKVYITGLCHMAFDVMYVIVHLCASVLASYLPRQEVWDAVAGPSTGD